MLLCSRKERFFVRVVFIWRREGKRLVAGKRNLSWSVNVHATSFRRVKLFFVRAALIRMSVVAHLFCCFYLGVFY